MIKSALIIYSEDDNLLGDYFSECGKHAEILLNQKEAISQRYIRNEECRFEYIEMVLSYQVNAKSLVLIYSHGDELSFRKNGVNFFDENIDADVCFDGGLIYTNACLTGKQFGKNIVRRNASYYGYEIEIMISPEESHQKDFITCDNYALSQLIEGKSLLEAKKLAKDKFTQMSDKYDDLFSPLVAGWLIEARDNIVIYGDTDKSFI